MANRGLSSIGIKKLIPAQIDFTKIVSGSAAGPGSFVAISSDGKAVLVNAKNLIDDSLINHDLLTGFVANEHIDHTSVSITAGDGLTGGGTIATTRTVAVGAGTGITVNASDVAFDPADGTTTTTNSHIDHVLINDGGVFKKIAPGSINISGLNNDSGFTTNVGDITGVTAGDGLSGGGNTGAVSLAVSVDDATIEIDSDTVRAKTAAIANGGTGLATADQIHTFVTTQTDATDADTAGNAATATKLAAAVNIAGVAFDGSQAISLNNNAITNGAGYTTNTGDITGVDLTGGTGIDIGSETNTTSGDYSATISVDVSDFMANGSNNRVVTATGADAQNAEANLTFNGSQLDIAGSVKATSYIWSQVTSDATFGSFYADNLSTHADAAAAMYFRLDNSTSTQKNAAIITVGKVQDWDSSANTDGYISFTTRVNDASSESMRIQNNNVGIGETAPTKTLTVRTADTNTTVASGKGLPGAAAGAGVLIHNESSTANTYANLDFRAGSADARIALQFKSLNNGDMHFVMDNSGTSTSQMIISNEGELFAPNLDAISGDYYMRYETDDGEIGYTTSTRVTKKNIESISSSRAIEIVNSLNPVNFEYKSEKMPGLKFGFIAEEVADVETNLSSYHADYQYNEETGKIERDEETGEKIIKSDARVPCMWSMEGVISVLVKVAQEQQKEIEDLKKQVESLQ